MMPAESKIPIHQKIYITILILVVAFIFGIIGNLLADPSTFHFTKELNPLHGISILVSLGCLLIISIWFDRYKETNKKKRECVQRRITEFILILNKIKSSIAPPNKPDIVVINSTIKALYHAKTDIMTILKHAKIDGKSFFDSYDDQHSRLRDLMTTSSVVLEKGAEPDVFVESNLISYSLIRISEIDTLVRQLDLMATLEEIRIYG